MKLTGTFRIIEQSALRVLLPLEDCIEVIDRCMRRVSCGSTELPMRWGVPVADRGAMGMMPGYLDEPECFGIKLVSLFPGNVKSGLSSHAGLMVLFEAKHGTPLALLDAGHLTAVRTAAASAVATRVLARPDAGCLAILGTGEQAHMHGSAMQAVRPLERVVVWGRDREKAAALAEKFCDELGIDTSVATTTAAAVAEADIVCSTTAARLPILRGKDLPPGCHINAVGGSVAEKREVDLDTVVRSRYFVDYRESAINQAGDLIHAISENKITASHILGEIGEVLEGQCDGRMDADDITLYRSLGVAAQDLAAAHYVYEQAVAADVGTVVNI